MWPLVIGVLFSIACGAPAKQAPRAHSDPPVTATTVATTTPAPVRKRSSAFTLIRGSQLQDPAAACDRGDLLACVTLSLGLLHSTERRQAFELLVEVCDAGELLACAYLGGYYVNDDGELVQPDPVRGRALLERACAANVSVGCSELARLVMREGDRPRARELFDKACGNGDEAAIRACIDFSIALQMKRFGASDLEAAIRVLERACSNDVALCAHLCDPERTPAATTTLTGTAILRNPAACKAAQRLADKAKRPPR